MKISWKLLLSFLLVGSMSAVISLGTYAYLNKDRNYSGDNQVFQQPPARLASFASAAENTDFTVAAENSVHAVVHIKSIAKRTNDMNSQRYFDPFEFFFGPRGGGGYGTPQQSQPRVGFGSGVIISSDGYIITNNHVIEGADELEVTTNDNKEYKAKLIGGDPVTDIALIKVEAKDLPVIPFGNSDELKVGEWVLAVGNPFNLTSTVTAGIVSAKGRGNVFPSSSRTGNTQMKVESFIQTDAAVNPGNSGGALVNTRGELVGINTAIYSETGNYAGYSFAVPVSIAQKVATDLKEHGAVQRAVLGVTIGDISALKQANPEEAAKLKVNEGAYVSGFAVSSAARDAGIAVGDVIIGVGGSKVKTVSELQELVNRYSPGSKVQIQVMRGDKEKTFTVELKNMQGGTDVVKNVSGTELLGASFKELSAEQKKQYGYSYGIEVTGLTNGKIKDVGITKGYIILSVNNVKVTSVDAFEKIIDQTLQQNAEDRGLFLKGFYPNGKVRYYAIDLNE